MMNAIQNPNRREAIFCGGLLLTAITQGKAIFGQSTDDEELTFLTTDPRNAEPKLDDLVQSWITPNKYFYVRSHAPNPEIDPTKFSLQIEGMVNQTLSLSLEDLREFREHTVTATLTCAGNRRVEFNQEREVGGVQWGPGAIGNATWTGVRLADVLRKAEVLESARHVWFEGLDEIDHNEEIIPFGASIPIEKALPSSDDEIGALLAYDMNGSPLTADHGFPLRTVVPGYIGARSVKWLGRIIVSDQPSTNHYVAGAYKIVRESSDLDWSEAGPIYRYPINAAIAADADMMLKAGNVALKGYVLPSGISGAKVKRVLVSTDSGKSWTSAELIGQEQDYCWRLWKANVRVTTATTELLVRATDSSGAFMPAKTPWNAKGYLQNSWFRLPVKIQ
jgi:sulfite oxidase